MGSPKDPLPTRIPEAPLLVYVFDACTPAWYVGRQPLVKEEFHDECARWKVRRA